ncbi:YadA family autotransporter adhesin, partial [Variovorax sp. Root318D1]|uniref:YadA family autotransporter adhesin n=1 Tax=Variovorax sp. Root318D1 TaxID=1736513 RepID=UPI000AAB6581
FTSVTTTNLTATGPTTLTGGTTIGGSLTLNPATTVNMGGNVITNVAAGTNPTDAVNLSQVTSATNALTSAGLNFTGNDATAGVVHRDLGTTLAIQGTAATAGSYSGGNLKTVTDPVTGAINLQMADSPVFGATTINAGGTGIISGVTAGVAGTDAVNVTQLNAVSTTANLGWNLQANGDIATNVVPGGTVEFVNGQNILLTHTGNTITVATSPDLVANSLTISGGPTINSSGITMNAGNTLNMGGNTITNVGAGVNLTDAVNLSQLNTATSTAANMWITGSPTVYVAPVSTGTNATAVGSGSSATGTNSVAVGTGAAATTANSVALGNDSTTGTATAVTGTTIGGTSYTFAGAAPTGVVSVGSAGAERQVTNVAAGQLTATSTDAVNGSQLYATNTAISNLGTAVTAAQTHYYSVNDGGVQQANYNNDGATGVNSLASGVGASATGAGGVAVGLNSVATGGNSIAVGAGSVASSAGGIALGAGSTATRAGMNGQREAFSNVSVSSTQGAVSVGSAGGERQITNVAGGTAATDAVNVRQLQAVKDGAISYSTNVDGTTNYNQIVLGNGQAPNGTVISNVAPGVAGTDAVNVNQLNGVSNRVNALGDQIDKVGRNAYAGVAAAMAVQMPGQSLPGKTVMRVGYGVFKGESAVGISFRRTAENNGWSLTGGVGMSRAGAAATVGAEWVFD